MREVAFDRALLLSLRAQEMVRYRGRFDGQDSENNTLRILGQYEDILLVGGGRALCKISPTIRKVTVNFLARTVQTRPHRHGPVPPRSLVKIYSVLYMPIRKLSEPLEYFV